MRLLATLLLIAVATITGCAGSAPRPSPSAAAAPGTPVGVPHWWIVHVRMGYDEVQPVQWHLDALLAEQVFAPLIERFGPALVLWRFHRRAAPDAAGHQMRFLFYADPVIAEQISAALRASSLLNALRGAGQVTEVLLPGPGESSGARIEDTGDPAWPAPVQRAWPHFAMGVSRNWLALITDVGTQRGAPDGGDLDALLGHYREVNAAVNALWQGNAQHAWLHHLNALFGYQPVLIQEQRLMRF